MAIADNSAGLMNIEIAISAGWIFPSDLPSFGRYQKESEIKTNPNGRLRVVHIGRSVRVREQDLIDFIDSLAKN